MAEQPPENSIRFVVPESERNPMQDIADEYAIELDPNAGCIIWGKYSTNRTEPEWYPNVSARWLVMLLLPDHIANQVVRLDNKLRASENSTDAQNTERRG